MILHQPETQLILHTVSSYFTQDARCSWLLPMSSHLELLERHLGGGYWMFPAYCSQLKRNWEKWRSTEPGSFETAPSLSAFPALAERHTVPAGRRSYLPNFKPWEHEQHGQSRIPARNKQLKLCPVMPFQKRTGFSSVLDMQILSSIIHINLLTI